MTISAVGLAAYHVRGSMAGPKAKRSRVIHTAKAPRRENPTVTSTALFQPANNPAAPEAVPAWVMMTAQTVNPVAEPR